MSSYMINLCASDESRRIWSYRPRLQPAQPPHHYRQGTRSAAWMAFKTASHSSMASGKRSKFRVSKACDRSAHAELVQLSWGNASEISKISSGVSLCGDQHLSKAQSKESKYHIRQTRSNSICLSVGLSKSVHPHLHHLHLPVCAVSTCVYIYILILVCCICYWICAYDCIPLEGRIVRICASLYDCICSKQNNANVYTTIHITISHMHLDVHVYII